MRCPVKTTFDKLIPGQIFYNPKYPEDGHLMKIEKTTDVDAISLRNGSCWVNMDDDDELVVVNNPFAFNPFSIPTMTR
jgi:hypothetical protein